MRDKNYQTGNPKIDQLVDQLAREYSTPESRSHIHDLFTTVIKLHLDRADDHDLYQANTTLKELRHIFRIFKPYRNAHKVVMFGSHRTPEKSREYKLAQQFAEEITKKGYMVITGGGGGIMEAGNRGAGSKGFAVKIKLPLEMKPNPYVSCGEKLINVKYFFTRKLAFIKESDATILFPGGFGTHDESFEVLTLLQTGKTLPRPVVMVDPPWSNYWKNWLGFLKKELIRYKYLQPADLNLFRIVRTPKAAVKEITGFYKNYHSICYGREATVIRLNKKIAPQELKKLSRKYRDIIAGELQPCGPLPAEVRSKKWLDLPRICFKFDRQSYNQLMGLIRDINTL